MVEATTVIARLLKVVGLVNIQFVLQDGIPYVLEVNPRASRTVPFLSKVTGVPMVQLATRTSLGESLIAEQNYSGGLLAAWRACTRSRLPFSPWPSCRRSMPSSAPR